MNAKEKEEQLKSHRKAAEDLVSPKRFNHILAVEAQARHLAKIYGADEFKAACAAILHDIAKEMNPVDQLAIIKQAGFVLPEEEMQSPKLWHAVAGAAYAKEKLGIKDEEILNAVLYHTTGRANMSLLEEIIFVADCTSADREYADVEYMRYLADQSLRKTISGYAAYIIKALAQNKQYVSKKTREMFEYYFER